MKYVKVSKKAFTGAKRLCSSIYSRQDALFDLVSILAFQPVIKGVTYEPNFTISYTSTEPFCRRWGWNHMRVGQFFLRLEEMGYIKRSTEDYLEKRFTWVSREIVLTEEE